MGRFRTRRHGDRPLVVTECGSLAEPAPQRVATSVLVGLVAIIVAFVGIGALHALQQPPFWPTDETAHVGYAHEVASFRLPEIRTVPEVPVAARQWQAERSMANDLRYRGVWVANHPPLHYVAVAPLVWISDATDATDGGLVLMRLANVAFAAVGVAFTFLLASELTRRNHRCGAAGCCPRGPGASGSCRVLASVERRSGICCGHGSGVGGGAMPASCRRSRPARSGSPRGHRGSGVRCARGDDVDRRRRGRHRGVAPVHPACSVTGGADTARSPGTARRSGPRRGRLRLVLRP
jgi:hypothetical protein